MAKDGDGRQALEQAIALHMQGRLDDAKKRYLALLDEDPGQPDALHWLGVIALQTGRPDEAVEHIGRALERRPGDADATINLGNALNALGRFGEAAEAFERALTLGPPNAVVLANLGGALAQHGRYTDAVDRFREALKLEPALAEARRSLADALAKSGRPNEALTEIRQAMAAGQPSLAMQVSLGNILAAAGRGDEAIACFEQLLTARPEIAPIRGNLGNVLRQLGRVDDAIAQYRQALDEMPEHAETWQNLGLAYEDIGDRDKALAAYRKAQTLDPNSGKAWHGIASVSKDGLADEEVEKLAARVDAGETPPEQRMRLAFALGRHHEKAGDHVTGARYYAIANPLRRDGFRYDADADVEAIGRFAGRFDTGFFERWQGSGSDDARPIFIVGMPRSGTTLVEQILASHPEVHGAGELTHLTRAIVSEFPMPDGVDYSAALDDATDEKFARVAARYLAALPETDAARITDKLPHNFLNVGMIRVLFPNASIVHCVRDPLDTCFSIYKNLFGAWGHFYAYDLEELARYYAAYAKLMAHWERLLPGTIHTVRYEDLVASQEKETRALLDACDLEWDSAVLEFYRHERPVATISASQVRRPVYRGSIGAWKNYEELLAPLIDILDAEGLVSRES